MDLPTLGMPTTRRREPVRELRVVAWVRMCERREVIVEGEVGVVKRAFEGERKLLRRDSR